ncbi:hypothetical protein BD293_0043 [Roseinatronobacter monicus]|uniref:Uncharacterized protein n=1 Tax=Roseinatronobacter monicus TaxID=393481 RepID=A0A543K8W8_9RHOB|nr:hypothetical protein BD293_0043 [Roseinatronobacter monicus]
MDAAQLLAYCILGYDNLLTATVPRRLGALINA